jgi:hypothetical protein
MLVRDKHTSLVVQSFNDKDEKFYNFGHRSSTDTTELFPSTPQGSSKNFYFGATTLRIKTLTLTTLGINDTSHLVRHIGLFSKHFPE